jgi:hypothetical protein
MIKKQLRVNVCLELQETANEDPTFTRISRIITSDESEIYGYDPEIKKKIVKRGRAHSHQEQKMAQQVWGSTKSMLIAFFNAKGTVHRKFVPPNTTVNFDFYCDILRHLRENVQ